MRLFSGKRKKKDWSLVLRLWPGRRRGGGLPDLTLAPLEGLLDGLFEFLGRFHGFACKFRNPLFVLGAVSEGELRAGEDSFSGPRQPLGASQVLRRGGVLHREIRRRQR